MTEAVNKVVETPEKRTNLTRYALVLCIMAYFGTEARNLGIPEAQGSAQQRVLDEKPAENIDSSQTEEIDTERSISLETAETAMTAMSKKIGLVLAGKIAWNFRTEESRTARNAANFIRTLTKEDQQQIIDILHHLAKYPEDQDKITDHCKALLKESTEFAILSPLIGPVLERGESAQQKAIYTLEELKNLEDLAVQVVNTDQ